MDGVADESGSPDRQAKRGRGASRSRQSCTRCRKHKVKCDGQVPCERCIRAKDAQTCQLWHTATGRPSKRRPPSSDQGLAHFLAGVKAGESSLPSDIIELSSDQRDLMLAETALLSELWTADVAPADDLSALEAAAPSVEAPSAEAVVSLWDWLQ